MVNIEIFIISVLLSFYFTIIFQKLFSDNGITARNYINQTVTLGLGIIFIFNQIFISTILIFWKPISLIKMLGYLLAITLMAFVGFMDDMQGNEKIKGLKGHLRALVDGEFTTGSFKAISGLIISIFFSIFISEGIVHTIINILVITLFTNTINLFDLRPGRAIKVSLFFLILFLLLSQSKDTNYMISASIGMLVGYAWIDLKGQAMMGDTGSNTLGMILGITCILGQNLTQKIAWLLITLLLHLLAEKHSFSKIIKQHKILNYLDHLGR